MVPLTSTPLEHEPGQRSTRPSIKVLLSLAPPDGTTKFVDQLVRYPPEEQTFRYFSWPTALFGRYDVFHVHWPEFLLRGRRVPVTVVRTLLFVLLLLRLRLARTPVVRTQHNLEPHVSGGRIETRLLRALDDLVTVRVVLNEVTPVSPGAHVRHIPHGHYVDVLPTTATTRSDSSLLYFGRIESYKNVPGLISAFRGVDDPVATLRVVGRANADLEAEITSAAAGDDRIGLHFGFVPDHEMVAEMRSAQLVVLPYLEMHNSGVLLVALSVGRPVLVPRTPANELMAAEVGAQWVLLYDGPISAKHLVDGLTASAVLDPDAAPTLEGRDWATVGENYYQAYVNAVSLRPSSSFHQSLSGS